MIPITEKDLRASLYFDGQSWQCALIDIDGNYILNKVGEYVCAYGATHKVAYQNLKAKLNIA